MTKQLKRYDIIGLRVMHKPYRKVVAKLLEVEKRNKEEAIQQGKNYAKMMGCEFSHVIEKGRV